MNQVYLPLLCILISSCGVKVPHKYVKDIPCEVRHGTMIDSKKCIHQCLWATPIKNKRLLQEGKIAAPRYARFLLVKYPEQRSGYELLAPIPISRSQVYYLSGWTLLGKAIAINAKGERSYLDATDDPDVPQTCALLRLEKIETKPPSPSGLQIEEKW